MNGYPWYALVNGDSLEQGDILLRCPVFMPLSSSLVGGEQSHEVAVEFEWRERDVIVLSQTCDLATKREKVAEVLLCAIWSCDEVGGHLATAKGKEDADVDRTICLRPASCLTLSRKSAWSTSVACTRCRWIISGHLPPDLKTRFGRCRPIVSILHKRSQGSSCAWDCQSISPRFFGKSALVPIGATDYLLKPLAQAESIALSEYAERRLWMRCETLAGTVATRHALP